MAPLYVRAEAVAEWIDVLYEGWSNARSDEPASQSVIRSGGLGTLKVMTVVLRAPRNSAATSG